LLLCTAALCQSNTCPGFFGGDLLETGNLWLIQASMPSSDKPMVETLFICTRLPSASPSLPLASTLQSVIDHLFSHIDHRWVQPIGLIRFQLCPNWQEARRTALRWFSTDHPGEQCLAVNSTFLHFQRQDWSDRWKLFGRLLLVEKAQQRSLPGDSRHRKSPPCERW
jgi:hypothetical protein